MSDLDERARASAVVVVVVVDVADVVLVVDTVRVVEVLPWPRLVRQGHQLKRSRPVNVDTDLHPTPTLAMQGITTEPET